ncbi:MAG: DUF3817 domain-containing protein [Flavobacteriales bacterium]|jgi:integral membrane protein|nr:DUF3817 domain-containing protein [Flavobacteriales bacterium]
METTLPLLIRFRKIALWEGASYLFLLFIAMPMKYFADFPVLVKYGGWVHGALFVAFSLYLLTLWVSLKWSFLRAAGMFVASLLPFGTFVTDKWVKAEIARLEN